MNDISIWFGEPVNGATPFWVTAVSISVSDRRAVLERRVSDMLAAFFATMPPVRAWRSSPSVDSDGDFATNTIFSVAKARGFFEHYDYAC